MTKAQEKLKKKEEKKHSKKVQKIVKELNPTEMKKSYAETNREQ